jgi:hypothetical protein
VSAADPVGVLDGVAGPAALATTAAGLVAAALTLAVTRRPGAALGVLLDLLLAAGLLRLAGDPGWGTITTAAVVVLLRHLAGAGLRVGARSWAARGGPPRAPRRLRPLLDRLPSGLAEDLLHPVWRR